MLQAGGKACEGGGKSCASALEEVRGSGYPAPHALARRDDKSLFSLPATAGSCLGSPGAAVSATCGGRLEGWARWGLLDRASRWVHPCIRKASAIPGWVAPEPGMSLQTRHEACCQPGRRAVQTQAWCFSSNAITETVSLLPRVLPFSTRPFEGSQRQE